MNPYQDWLDIDSESTHPNRYELLGLAPFEQDAQAISAAYRQRFAVVRQYEVGPHSDQAIRLLEEISDAYRCLTSQQEKLQYDNLLRQSFEIDTVIEGELLETKVDEPLPLSASRPAGTARPKPAIHTGSNPDSSDSHPPRSKKKPPRATKLKTGQALATETAKSKSKRGKRSATATSATGQKTSHRIDSPSTVPATTPEAEDEIYTATLVEEQGETTTQVESRRGGGWKLVGGLAVAVLLLLVASFLGGDDSETVALDPILEQQISDKVEEFQQEVTNYNAALSAAQTAHASRLESILVNMQYESAADFQAKLASAVQHASQRAVVIESNYQRTQTLLAEIDSLLEQIPADVNSPESSKKRLVWAEIGTELEALPTPTESRSQLVTYTSQYTSTELDLLEACEAAVAGERPIFDANAQSRISLYLNRGNPQLAYRAIAATIRFTELPNSFAGTLQRLQWTAYTMSQQANLCDWLHESGDPQAWKVASARLKSHPQLLAEYDASTLLTFMEAEPENWKPLILPLQNQLTDAKASLRLLRLQAKLQDPTWLDAIEVSATKGPLSSVAGEVIETLVVAKWSAAYPLIKSIVETNQADSLSGLRVDQLNQLKANAPEIALSLAIQLLPSDQSAQRQWAVSAFLTEQTFTEQHFAKAMQYASTKTRTACLNQLLTVDSQKAQTACLRLLASESGITPEAIHHTAIHANMLSNAELMGKLTSVLWKGNGEARQWIIKQKYNIDILQELAWALARQANHEQHMVNLNKVIVDDTLVGKYHHELVTRGAIGGRQIGDLSGWTEESARLDVLQEACDLYAAKMKSPQSANIAKYVNNLGPHADAYRSLVLMAQKVFSEVDRTQNIADIGGYLRRRRLVPHSIYKVPLRDYEQLGRRKKQLQSLSSVLQAEKSKLDFSELR